MKLAEFIDNSESLLPGVYNRAVVEQYHVFDMTVTDMVGMKSKIVSARLVSLEDREYKVVVQVNRVDLGCTEENDLLVRCNCPSFRFWFAEADKEHGVLFGQHFAKYIPVPDHLLKRPRPLPKNPEHKPGCCKHVFDLIKVMKRERIMA